MQKTTYGKKQMRLFILDSRNVFTLIGHTQQSLKKVISEFKNISNSFD